MERRLRRLTLGVGAFLLALSVSASAESPSSGAELETLREQLRAAGLPRSGEVLLARVRQRSPKMKLTKAEAHRSASALLKHRALAGLVALDAIMPESTVELGRAVVERGVSVPEAERICAYLIGFALAIKPDNLKQLDINHSHVIGREWHEIDYRGERMTWQGQKAYWSPRGVLDFKTAQHIHRYFTHAVDLPYFRRIYRPRGRFVDVPRPSTPR